MGVSTIAVREPIFKVGAIPVYGDLILAPMSGFSDLPFRALCRSIGSAMSYTEFVSAREVLHGRNPHVLRALTYLPEERPVVMQVFDADEDRLVAAAQRLEKYGPDIIDINMGCSVHRVATKGAGAGLLRDPDKVARIMKRTTASVRVPVTAKIRLGWDWKSRNYPEVVHALQENGAAMIAVHGRTRDQGYTGSADWDAIARIVEQARVPVIGNGDVLTPDDADRLKAETGCAAVMIGRGAVGHPWIFKRLHRNQVTPADRLALVRRHFLLMLESYGTESAVLRVRKHLTRYLNEWPGIKELRPRLVRISSVEDFDALITHLENQKVTGLPTCLPASSWSPHSLWKT